MTHSPTKSGSARCFTCCARPMLATLLGPPRLSEMKIRRHGFSSLDTIIYPRLIARTYGEADVLLTIANLAYASEGYDTQIR